MRLAATLIVMLSSITAFASLGGSESTIEHDRRAFSATRKSPDGRGSYTVHQMDTDGNTVREYLSADGTVFAVTWQGIAPPDLSQLFGTYYTEYTEALKNEPKRKGRAPRTIQASHIVVQLSGHMHAIRGVAYVPSLMPAGVTPDEFRNGLQ